MVAVARTSGGSGSVVGDELVDFERVFRDEDQTVVVAVRVVVVHFEGQAATRCVDAVQLSERVREEDFL